MESPAVRHLFSVKIFQGSLLGLPLPQRIPNTCSPFFVFNNGRQGCRPAPNLIFIKVLHNIHKVMRNIMRGQNKKVPLNGFLISKRSRFRWSVGRALPSKLGPFSLGYPIHLEVVGWGSLVTAEGMLGPTEQFSRRQSKNVLYFFPVRRRFFLFFFFFTFLLDPWFLYIRARLGVRPHMHKCMCAWMVFLRSVPVRFTIMGKQSLLNS